MDTLIKALAPGLLFRSLFAGFFFLVSFRTPGHHEVFPPLKELSQALPLLASSALIVGFTAYTLHRAVLYPLLETALNSTGLRTIRHRLPLIYSHVVRGFLEKWSRGRSTDAGLVEQEMKIAAWADGVHFLYVSSLCIAFGSLARRSVDPGTYTWSAPLLIL